MYVTFVLVHHDVSVLVLLYVCYLCVDTTCLSSGSTCLLPLFWYTMSQFLFYMDVTSVLVHHDVSDLILHGCYLCFGTPCLSSGSTCLSLLFWYTMMSQFWFFMYVTCFGTPWCPSSGSTCMLLLFWYTIDVSVLALHGCYLCFGSP